MWVFVFDAVLFYAVTYLGTMYSVNPIFLALIFATLHHLLGRIVERYEYFNYMPDTRPIPPCPRGMERGSNGMDCKSKGDRYGM